MKGSTESPVPTTSCGTVQGRQWHEMQLSNIAKKIHSPTTVIPRHGTLHPLAKQSFTYCKPEKEGIEPRLPEYMPGILPLSYLAFKAIIETSTIAFDSGSTSSAPRHTRRKQQIGSSVRRRHTDEEQNTFFTSIASLFATLPLHQHRRARLQLLLRPRRPKPRLPNSAPAPSARPIRAHGPLRASRYAHPIFLQRRHTPR